MTYLQKLTGAKSIYHGFPRGRGAAPAPAPNGASCGPARFHVTGQERWRGRTRAPTANTWERSTSQKTQT